MKFTIQKDALLQALQMIVGALEKNQTMPILGNALVTVTESEVSFLATDLEIELQSRVSLIGTIETGQITIPAKKLMDITKALTTVDINLKLDGQTLIVSSGRSRFKLMTLPATDFPNIEEGQNNIEFSISQKDLRHLIERVYFSMAQQDVRYYLNGILLIKSKGHLRAVATDGHRLATSHVSLDLSGDDSEVIIPRKGVLELLRLLNSSDDLVKAAIGDNHFRILGAGYTFVSKLIDGKFPDYQRVLPKNANKIIDIERDELKQLLARTAILSNEKYHGVKLSLRDNKLVVEANNAEQEEAIDEIEINYNKEHIEIGFNVTYLLDVLSALKPGGVKIAFTDNNSSIILQQAIEDTSLYVVMPMRI